MPSQDTILSVEEWFEYKCEQLSLDPDVLIHPAEVDHKNAEYLIGSRVLLAHKTPTGERRDDHEVQEIREVRTGNGMQTFAVWGYQMGNTDHPIGMNIEIDDRENLDGWDKQVRFIPPDIEPKTNGPKAAIERLRDFSSQDSIFGDDAQDIAEALGGELDPSELHGETISVPIFLRRMVSQVTDESPISAGDYFGKAIGGHKKSDRGVYKGNLTVLEEHFGFDPTYSRSE